MKPYIDNDPRLNPMAPQGNNISEQISEEHFFGDLLSSKESVALAIVAWAKRRIMNNSIDTKELDSLLEAARAAGRAEGYAQARFEIALERAKFSDHS